MIGENKALEELKADFPRLTRKCKDPVSDAEFRQEVANQIEKMISAMMKLNEDVTALNDPVLRDKIIDQGTF